MPTAPRIPGAAGALRLGGSLVSCVVLACGLLAFGRAAAAIGAGIGLGFFLANTFFLYLTLQSLVGATSRRAAAIAGVSSAGRMLLLGFLLWWILTAWGRETALGAGGGLALAQISLFFRRSGARGGA